MVLRPQKQATSIGPLALAALRMGTVKVIGSLTSQRRGPSLWVKVSATIAAFYLVANLWLWQQTPPKPRVWNPLFGYLPQGQMPPEWNVGRPTVSVILPNYNGAHSSYLQTAVESILGQDFADFELIVVDDGSTDSSVHVLRRFVDPRLFVLEKDHSSLPDTLNHGHFFARGRYLTWVSADNVHYKDFLSTLVSVLNDYVETGIAISDHKRIDDDGKFLGDSFMPWQLDYPDVLGVNPGIMSFLYTRKCFDRTGPYRLDLEGVEDVELWVRMLGACRSVYVRRQLAEYRIHARRMSATMADLIRERDDLFKIEAQKNYGTDKFLDSLGQDIAVNKREAQNMELYRWGLRYLYLHSLRTQQQGLRSIAMDLLAACAASASSVQEACAQRLASPDSKGWDVPQHTQGRHEAFRAMSLAKAAYTVDVPAEGYRRKPRVLAVVPSDPLVAYVKKGRESTLQDYYNPLGFFDKVYALTPRETEHYEMAGMTVIPTQPEELAARLAELKVDVIRAYGGYWASDYAVYNRHPDIPVIVSVHDTNPRLLHTSILGADYVWSVSDAVSSALLAKGVEQHRLLSFTNRVDVELFGARADPKRLANLRALYPAGKYRILHVGRKEAQKNGDTVIRALAHLGPDYSLVMLGPGKEEWLWKVADEAGVRDRVYMVQGVSNTELPAYYQMADCLCNPSRWEGFGIVFIEALAAGAVVVTSNQAPMNEIVHHERNGLLVDSYEDPAAVAREIARATTDATLRQALSRHARHSALTYSKQRVDVLEAQLYRLALRNMLPAQTMAIPAPTNCTDYARQKNINLTYEVMEDKVPVQLPASAYQCLDALYFRVSAAPDDQTTERHIGWARPEAHDNHPWYSSALHNKVPRTYAYFRGFGVQQPEDPSPEARELRAAAHRTEYCVRMMLGAMFPANVQRVYAAEARDVSGAVYTAFTVTWPRARTEYRVRTRRTLVPNAIVPHGAPPQYRVDVEAFKVDAAKHGPKVTFVISNKNTNPATDVHAKALFDMLYHVVVMQNCTGDTRLGLVIVDYESTNQEQIKEVCRRIDAFHMDCRVIPLAGNYSRAGGLQAGAASRPADEIVFTLDTFLLMALDLPGRLRDVVKRNKTVYAPLVWRNERGAPVLVTPPEAGKYEEYGYGIMGYYVGDLLATHKWNKSARAVDYVGGYDTDRFREKRGGEDEDLGGRMLWVNGLSMVRTAENNAVVHLWHPPVNNPVWQDPSKIGAWVHAPSYNGSLYPHLRFDNVQDAVDVMYGHCPHRRRISKHIYGQHAG